MKIGQESDELMPAIMLSIDSSLKGEAYSLDIDKTFNVRGGDYNAVALGTVTLLQALTFDAGGVTAPKLNVNDHPAFAYRGLMLDCARVHHGIDNLKQAVVLARAYKIPYLQLHLSDDQGFTFPSTAFSKLATPNHSYTLEELRDLQTFARDRGIIIVPEIDVPGHSGGLNKVAPEIFGGAGSTINCGDEKAIAALNTLVGEILDVFPTTPYFHIGSDEVWFGEVAKLPSFQARMRELGTADPQDVFRWFIGQMDGIVKKHGRTTICWEGFGRGGKVHVPTDVIVMPFDCIYYDGSEHLLEDGYKVINASWTPLYVVNDHKWSADRIYDWNVFKFSRFSMDYPTDNFFHGAKTPLVLGGQMCTWEQGPDVEINSLRNRLPAMAERLWNPDAGKDYADFASRAVVADQTFQRWLSGMDVHMDGLAYPGWDGPGRLVDGWFREHATISLASAIPGATIRYEVGNGPVTSNSSAYEKPIELTADRSVVKAQAFDASGKPLGFAWTEIFERHPIEATFTGQEASDAGSDAPSKDQVRPVTRFKEKISVDLHAAVSGGMIRYTINGGQPTASSPITDEAIALDDSATIRARWFDSSNQPQGQMWMREFLRTGPVPNLTLNKPVTCSSNNPANPPENAVDGLVELGKFWGTDNAPQWLKVDLQQPHDLTGVDVITYWDSRYYQYVVEVSTDDKQWKQVVDMSRQHHAGNAEGISSHLRRHGGTVHPRDDVEEQRESGAAYCGAAGI